MLLGADIALAALRRSDELPADWQSFSVDERTVVCARIVMTPGVSPDGQLAPAIAAAITFDLSTGEANVVATARGVPRRCVCDKAASAERCVCVGGAIDELQAGLLKALASKELARLGQLDRVQTVLEAWTAMLKLVVGAELCHGLRNPRVEARLAIEPDWPGPSQVDLRTPARLDPASGKRVVGFAAKEKCAVLVNGSSIEGQQLRFRNAQADETGASLEDDASSGDEATSAEGQLVICDACYACKVPLRNAARTASKASGGAVSKFTPISKLSEADRAAQAASKLAEKNAAIARFRKQIDGMKATISSSGAIMRTPDDKTEQGLFAMLAELGKQLGQPGGIDASALKPEGLAMLRAQEELVHEYRRQHGTLNGMRWSHATLFKAYQLYAGNKAKYDWLCKSGLVALPSASQLQRTFGSNETTGHDLARYQRINARTAHLEGQQRWGALNRDEMKVQDGLVLRKKDGDEWAFIGFTELSTCASNTGAPSTSADADSQLPPIAGSMLMYLFTPCGHSGKADANGIKAQQAFIVAAYAVSSLTSERIWVLDLEVMANLSKQCNLHVLALTSDGAPANRQVAKRACDGADAGLLAAGRAYDFGRCFCPHPIYDGSILIFLMDPSHGEKKAVSAARHSGGAEAQRDEDDESAAKKVLWAAHRPILEEGDPGFADFDGNCVRWSTAVAMFKYDEPHTVKVYRHVTRVVVYPTTLETMRMSTARGVLNRDTLAQLRVMRTKGAVHAARSSTFEWYFETMLRIFDPMRGGNGAYASTADPRLQQMEEALAELAQWRSSLTEEQRRVHFISAQLWYDIQSMVHGWRHTLEQLEKLASAHGWQMEPVSPTVVAQDRTESIFGEIRALYAGGAPTFANALSAIGVIDTKQDARKADNTHLEQAFDSAKRPRKTNIDG